MDRLDVHSQPFSLTCTHWLSQGTAPTNSNSGEAMIYDLTMPRKDFDRIDSLVRDITKPSTKLVMATQDALRLNYLQWQYIQENPESLGVTFMDEETGEFDVWISPSFTHWDSPWTLDTVLHELTHGYAKAMNHGQFFRRTLTKALYRYETEIGPIRADWFARGLVNRYSEDDHSIRQLELEFSKKEALRA